MRIDVHAHYYPTDLVDRMEALGSPFVAGARHNPGAGVTLDQRIELLDGCGIHVQVLCGGAQQAYFAAASKAVDGARYLNDYYRDVAAKYGGRFSAFGVVPLPHVDAAIAEAARCLDELGFPGLNLGCSVAGQPLDDPLFVPFWQEMERRQAAIFLHPLGIGAPMSDAYQLDWLVAGCFEDTITALRLAFSNFTAKYPNVKVIVPHLGGTVPFVWGRMWSPSRRQAIDGGATPDPVEGMRKLYYDSVNRTPGALKFAVPLLGADRVMLGTDFPYQTPEQFKADVACVSESGLPPEQIEAILDRNAQAILHLPEP